MEKPEFKKLIRANEKDLERIRSKYFPLIEGSIITGYNLYSNLFDYSKGNLFLNYFHSGLRPENRHYQELCEKLRIHGLLERIIVKDELLDKKEILERNADYITRPGWDDPLDMRYFDYGGVELTREEAEELGEEIIGESFQYNLLLRIKNESELRKIINLFKKYASKYKLDKNGRKIIKNDDPVENENSIHKAWDIPLLVCTSKTNKKPRNLCDFIRVNEFNIIEKLGNMSIILNSLVRTKRKDFYKILKERKERFQFDKKYALRMFVESYIDI